MDLSSFGVKSCFKVNLLSLDQRYLRQVLSETDRHIHMVFGEELSEEQTSIHNKQYIIAGYGALP